ncbi:MAG: Sensor protein ZraS [Syntrophorhabdus sp. PtaU1.Bin058]|nr:MAG: Sensor protein ZraS [Syntrophorhabdus sp. PtaU1.Bin058]
MASKIKLLEREKRELEVALEEARSLSLARNKLLAANIRELSDIYDVLKTKLQDLRQRDERIKSFEEELMRANKLAALGELAGSIAHEIKNPLISIQGFAGRILKTGDKERIEKYARLIEKEAERLSTVLIKLLEYSRMDTPRKERVGVDGIIDDTVLFMEHHLTRFKNIEVSVEKGKDIPPVMVDKIHVQQALVNIIINAAQSMPNGGTVHIRSGVEGNNAYISVTDSGGGIEPENIAKIFEPFFTTKPKGEGTGLGLSICKRLMKANDGDISVESVPGQGSTFKLLMPLYS